MTDEIIKQVDKNALNALKAAVAENDHVKQAVKTGTALKLVGKSAELEKMKFDQELATKKHNLEEDKTKFDQELATKKQNLEEDKVRLQNDLERQRRIDMIHEREAKEAIEEANRISEERQFTTRLIIEGLSSVGRIAGAFALVKYGIDVERDSVVAGKFIDFAIRQFPNPFRKG